MTIVVDSNIVAALVLPVSYSPQSVALMDYWRRSGECLITPVLFEYEATSLIRRSVVSHRLDRTQALPILSRLLNSGPVTIPPTKQLHTEALGQSKAYDAPYLAPASRENAPLRTAGRRLANGARDTGLGRFYWIGDWSASG